MSESETRTLCLTPGDSSGIGPEITVKFLHRLAEHPDAPIIRVFGDIPALRRMSAQLTLPLPETEQVRYEDLSDPADVNHPEGQTGKMAYRSLEAAVAEIHAGRAHALVTGPISKERLQEAGLPFTGHTEILQHLARKYYQRPYQSDMLFVYGAFRMLLLTRHVPLRKVSESLSVKNVVRSLQNLSEFLLHRAGVEKPRLCMLGVNPHAGELADHFSEPEEIRILQPAARLISRQYGFDIEPPVAADAAFRHFNADNPPYDAYVATYHDQGLIPFKMVAGLNAVNVTIGLPFLRTSVSHGTAPDIVGRNLADPASLEAAYRAALQFMGNYTCSGI